MLQPGDYGVTPGGGWPMRWVRAWTGHPPFLRPAWAGHAALVERVDEAGSPTGGTAPAGHPIRHLTTTVHLIEATPHAGVRRRVVAADDPAWRWSANVADLTDSQRAAIVQRARSVLGRPYDWPSVVGVGLRVLWARYRGYAYDHPDTRLFCSELVAWCYREAGYDLFPGIAPGTVSPDALDRRLNGPLTRQPGPNA